ncbi:hypothetical protein A6R68_13354 [Neotoma lepida]|uniref:Uncharacterized protein n=1 Tax=Neotoma lepida TaxID=56216 RepID=A0A1A6H0F5_NEOLE|nr:hypothetical protein A6R68_13354 [Neotoma lepida]
MALEGGASPPCSSSIVTPTQLESILPIYPCAQHSSLYKQMPPLSIYMPFNTDLGWLGWKWIKSTQSFLEEFNSSYNFMKKPCDANHTTNY